MNKKSVFIVLNVFFLALAAYTISLFTRNADVINPETLVANSSFKAKTFDTEVKEVISQKGLKAWLLTERSAPIIALNFYFKNAGYAFDEQGKSGLAMLTAGMLEYGATNLNNEVYHDLLEENAIGFDFDVSASNFNVSVIVPAKNLNIAADLIKRFLNTPRFSEKNLQIVKERQLEALKLKTENPEKILASEFKKIFYASHPKSNEALGESSDLLKISVKDLQNFASTHFLANQLVVAIAGDIKTEDAQILLDEIFGSLNIAEADYSLPALEPNYVFEEQNIERDMPQVLSRFVAHGTIRLAPDFYALYMANEIFGGSGLSSRLNVAAREKEGLTYGAYTYLDSEKNAPSIQGGFATSVENYSRMREILFEEWHKMAEFGVSKEEFDAVKNNMLTSFNLRFQSISDIASQLLYMQKENLGMDFFEKRNEYVNNVTLDDVNQAAHQYFQTLPSVLTIGNNLKGD